jgi:hypothetical protein
LNENKSDFENGDDPSAVLRAPFRKACMNFRI